LQFSDSRPRSIGSGESITGFAFFVVVSANYFFAALIVPAVVGGLIHLWSILDAAKFKGEI